MANPALLQKKKGKYLWFALLGLGLQPDAAISSLAIKARVNVKHINLGPNMFDKPNKDASYIVIHFLLMKLNPTRFHESYRRCWPVLDHKLDAEFRKVTCAWLREIVDEIANAGSKVVASLFLSPGGPKFISLMLQLANHVMLQEIKTFTTDGSWVPEAAAMPASSVDMATKRLQLTTKRFLKTAVDQDHFLQEYQRRAPLLVKSTGDFREESAKYNELLKRYSNSVSEGEQGLSPAEKITKVRSLWSDIDHMLFTIKEEQNAVASVLKGEVDQFILDGTDRVLKVPRSLLERIEQLPYQLTSGNVYEAGQLNLLCVLELTNHALQILRDERRRVPSVTKSELNAQHLQEKCQQMTRMLQDLHIIRQKISKEEIPGVKSAICNLEAEWDRKWMNTLKDTPLVSFLNEDPALGFLSPMAPLSFKPAAEANYRSSVFSLYPAKLLEEKPSEDKSQEVVNLSFSDQRSLSVERSKSPALQMIESPSRANMSQDWLFDRPPPSRQRTPSVPMPQTNGKKMTHVHPKVAPARTKTDILDLECDNLADQFADAVTTGPAEGRVKSLELEGLLSTLHGNPFSSRKQLPRTPESLILDVKSSWRKALEETKAEKVKQSTKLNDSTAASHNSSTTQLVSSFQEPWDAFMCSEAPSENVSHSMTPSVMSHSSPPVCQQGSLVKSTLLWDTFNADAISPSDTGSRVVQFSLDHETLPELPSCDSMLSLSDEVMDMKSEEEEEEILLLPSLKPEVKQPSCDDGVFTKSRERTPECLLSGHAVSNLDREWFVEPLQSENPSDNVFSLDLDTLGTPSPPKKQEYGLPKLITFSPIDDMKC